MRIFTASNQNVLLLKDNGETICALPPTPLSQASFNHSGDRLILSNLQVYDLKDPSKPTLRDTSITLPSTGTDLLVVYSKAPSSTVILVAQDSQIHLYDRAKARITKSIITAAPPTCLIGNGNGVKIAYASESGIVLHNLEKDMSTPISPSIATHLAFGGKNYLAASTPTSILLFDILSTKSTTYPSPHSAPITSLAFLDSKVVTASLDGTLAIQTINGTSESIDIGAGITCMDIHGLNIAVGTVKGMSSTLITGDVYVVNDGVKSHVFNIGGSVQCIAVQPPMIAKVITKVSSKAGGKLSRKTPGVVGDGALMDFFSPVVAGRRARNVRTTGMRESVKAGENAKAGENVNDENVEPGARNIAGKKVEAKEPVLETVKVDKVEPIQPKTLAPIAPQSITSTDPTPEPAAPSFQYKIIESAISTHITAFRTDMMTEIQDMHVEMMRQFCLQREDMEGMLREYGVEPLVRELRELREENERLRRNY